MKELRADAWIKAHGMRYLLDVRANLLAKIRNDVGVADFQRQERVRSMLDQLRAVDGGHKKFCCMTGRAWTVVNRTMEAALKNGAVDLSHLGGGGFFLHANDDTVGVEEIIDRGAFAKKLGIGSHPKTQIAGSGIGR